MISLIENTRHHEFSYGQFRSNQTGITIIENGQKKEEMALTVWSSSILVPGRQLCHCIITNVKQNFEFCSNFHLTFYTLCYCDLSLRETCLANYFSLNIHNQQCICATCQKDKESYYKHTLQILVLQDTSTIKGKFSCPLLGMESQRGEQETQFLLFIYF